MKIGIIGWWHHDNQGDLAMLEALTHALTPRQVVPIDVGFDINADTLQRLDQLDFLLLGGGTQFQSTPPFPFDSFDVWGRDLQTPVGAVGIGIDMIAPQYRPAVMRLVEQAAFFYVRDQHSQQILDHPKAQIASDITFLRPILPARAPDDSAGRKIVCGTNLRRTPGLQTDRWIEALQSLPFTLRGIPLSTYQEWQELPILQQIDKACAATFQPSLYDGLDLMIGTAFHSVIFAVQAGVPVVAIASTPKVRRFMCDVGLADYLIEPGDWSKLGELSDKVLSERQQLRLQLRQVAAALAESAQQAMTNVLIQIDKAAVHQKDIGPKVSLIVVGGTTSEANRLSLESCLDQTYANLEVLFIGHDPNMSEFSALAPTKLKIISADTESLGECLNLAFSQAAGEYRSWIRSGDFYARDAVESMVYRLQSEPAYDMVFTDFYTVQDRNRIVDAHLVLEPGKLIRRNVIGPSFLFRRRLSDLVGSLRSDTPLADYDYWLRANTVCRLEPLHALLLYCQLPHHAIYSRAAERATRRRWYATRPWPMRTVGRLVDTDFIEVFVVRPLLAIRRGVRRLLSHPRRRSGNTARSKA
jgi:polysaccharide pyruvyl transferase WcaK-like protein